MAKTDFLALKEKNEKELVDEIVQSIKAGTPMWQKPWDSGAQGQGQYQPFFQHNPITGTVYTGINWLRLYHAAEKFHYKDNRWYTYNGVAELKGRTGKDCFVKKGSKGVPIYKFIQYDKLTKKDADWATIKKLPIEEQRKYIEDNIITAMKYASSVFNGDCIYGLEPLQPPTDEERQKHQQEVNKKLETIIGNSAAPIYYEGNKAYYDLIADSIHLPPRECFMTDGGFYGTAIHEIGHSTGHPSRLNRDMSGNKHSIEYAKEELVAELTSLYLNIEFRGGLARPEFENYAAYLKSWAEELEENYKAFYVASGAASKAASYIKQNYMVDIAASAQSQREEPQPKFPLVVNLYGGPGAGKTTAAMEITVALKKAGYNVEYVSEYAKELVLKNELDKLRDQKRVTDEQYRRLDRLRSSVDIIVTDSPVLLGTVYGEGKIDDAYKAAVKGYYDSFINKDFMVHRGEHFQQAGRLENLEQSKALDERIASMLRANGVSADDYYHDHVSEAVTSITSAFESIRPKVAEQSAPASAALTAMRAGAKFIKGEKKQDVNVLE